VQAQVDELVETRRSLNEALNDRFCPVLQLPPEISTEVLKNCLPAVNAPVPLDRENTPMTPFQLGHICRNWRNLVWSTPNLWSTVYLDLSIPINDWVVDEWLSRSGRQPLSIHLHLPLAYRFYEHDEADRGVIREQYDSDHGILPTFASPMSSTSPECFV
jgi:F-box-like